MKTKIAKISTIKTNPDNPRVIKDDKFKRLVQSIKDFPEMLEIRPIVCNSSMIVLGGNMRLRAAIEAKLKEVPVIIADNLTEEQQREFIIKDNVSGGEWDWEVLANEWDAVKLEDWGLDLPTQKQEEDVSDKIAEHYKVEIECDGEREQQDIYERLINEGYKCRLLTL